MKILAFDTSTNFLSIACLQDEDIKSRFHEDSGLRHSEILVPTIGRILEGLKWDIRDIDLMVVGLGPGSFTGLRIGIATLKAIVASCGTKIAGVPTMDAIALNSPEDKMNVAPFLDAHKGKVYTCLYERREGKLVRGTDYSLVRAEEFLGKLNKKTFFFGNGIEKYRKELDSCDFAEYIDNIEWHPKAEDIARLAFGKIPEGYMDAGSIEPLYLHSRDCAITKKKE